MKKYKINNRIIQAKSPTDALKINKIMDSIKDDIKSDTATAQNMVDRDLRIYGEISEETIQFLEKTGLKVITKAGKQIVTDAINNEEEHSVDIDYLINQEKIAINDYKKAIQSTNDKDLIYLFSHILTEETEHLEELEKAKIGNFFIDDSINDVPSMESD